MRLLLVALAITAAAAGQQQRSAAAARVGYFSRTDGSADRAPIDRLVAYLQRRLLRPTFQRAGEDQCVEREAPEPRVDLRHACRSSAWVDGDSGAGRRRAVFFRIRPGVCRRGAHGPRALALRLSQPASRWRRQSRRGRARRLGLLHPGVQSRRARHQDRRAEMGEGVLLDGDDVLLHGGPRRHQGQGDRRRQRRRSRSARVSRRTPIRQRRVDLAVVRDAAERGRSRPGHLAESRHGQARRWHDLAAGHVQTRS